MTGTIPFATAVPIILGQNIGTTITPVLSSITGNTESKRVAIACVYIKIIGVVIVYSLFLILNGVIDFAFMHTNISSMQIAVVHTMFNILSTIVLIPFTTFIEKLTIKSIKAKQDKQSTEFVTLDD